MRTDKQLLELLNRMSLSQKVGQMTQVFEDMLDEKNENLKLHQESHGFKNEIINEIGSVSGVGGAARIRELQTRHLENSDIPLLFMMDVIHGYRLNYQIAAGLGGAFDTDLLHRLSKMQANEAVAAGVSISYTPMSDMTNDPRWGRVMEIPSEDVYLNELYMKTIVESMQGDHKLASGHMGTCVKHIAGYGLAEGGRDYGDANVSKYSLENMYYPLYKAGINANSLMAMTAFNTIDGKPSTGNKRLLRDKLRTEWGFKGVLISDHSSINELITHGYAANAEEACIKAIEAGVDIELGTFIYRNNLEKLVEAGRISESLVDQAVLRILKLKNTLGLFDNPFAGLDENLEAELQTKQESRDLCREAGNKSIILLKNTDNLLPLNKKVEFDLCGPLADTTDLIGFNACNGVLSDTITVKEGLSEYSVNYILGIGYEENTEQAVDDLLASSSDIVVMAIGEQSRYSGEGISRSNISIPDSQMEIVKKLHKAGKKIIAIVFSGRPLELTDLNEYASSILFAWFPGTETGNSIADIISGKANPSAKTSFTFVKSLGQIPLKYNHLNTGRPKTHPTQEYVNGYRDIDNQPLYPFGYGLSYSQFELSDFCLDKHSLTRSDEIKLTVNIKNISEVNGTEVVQLYIRDLVAEYCRPVLELKAYQKVDLAPNEEKQLEFIIKPEMLSYFDETGSILLENGEFEVHLGNSSEDTQAKIIELIN